MVCCQFRKFMEGCHEPKKIENQWSIGLALFVCNSSVMNSFEDQKVC